jgi:AcrR family transcriptional regulator
MTFAGPANRATPISPSAMLAVGRDHRRRVAVLDLVTVTETPVRPKCEINRFLILPGAHAGCQDDAMTGQRPYGGVDAMDRLERRRRRLLEAGLDLLGSEIDPSDLTVRSICSTAGVATRYFYESYSDKDDFVGAVFDWAVNELAASTQSAVAAADPSDQTRAGIGNLVRSIDTDRRVGRLLFSAQLSNAAVARKRQESVALFAMLSGQHVETKLKRPVGDQSPSEKIRAFAHFIVGGVGQTISAWLTGEIEITAEQLADQLTATIDTFMPLTLDGQPRSSAR